MSEGIKFQLKREYIVESLRAAIWSGEFKPGQKLRQDELADRFGISSTPVREALRQLEAEGLVTSVAHQGVVVTRLSHAEIKERYRLRALLESYATREAVTHLQADPDRRQQLLADLQKLQESLSQAIQHEQKGEAVRFNNELHLRLYDEADSPLLKSMIVDLWKKVLPFSSYWIVPGRAAQALTEHDALLKAIAAGDAQSAERLVHEHIDVSEQVLEHLDPVPPDEAS